MKAISQIFTLLFGKFKTVTFFNNIHNLFRIICKGCSFSYIHAFWSLYGLGTVKIQTNKLLLRRFTERDASAAYNIWTSDEKVTEFLRWPTQKSIEITKSVINGWINSYKNVNFYQWAIVFIEYGDEPIGTISIVDKNERANIVHIGYCIGSKWWNQGITSEAFSGINPFLFDEVKANRIE